MIHHPSGARGESREERSQLQNKRRAFLRMVESREFRLWLMIATGRVAAAKAELARVRVPDEELRVEVRRAGRWVAVRPEELRP